MRLRVASSLNRLVQKSNALAFFVRQTREFHTKAAFMFHASPATKEYNGVSSHPDDTLAQAISKLQKCNECLWYNENLVRQARAAGNNALIPKLKEKIDFCNTHRNLSVERIDQQLLKILHGGADKLPEIPHTKVVANSQTPGRMIDEIGINRLRMAGTADPEVLYELDCRIHRTELLLEHLLIECAKDKTACVPPQPLFKKYG